MKTSDFYYDLPKELIAQDPLEDRSASRLMHLDKTTGEYKHGHFRDILQYLKPGDCLVGIISHVPELKDRIEKKIVVTKNRSRDGVGSRAVIE